MQSTLEGKPPVFSVECLTGLVAPWPAEMELESTLVAATAATLLEELGEGMASAPTETTSEWVPTLASHRVVRVISVVVSLTKFCTRRSLVSADE